MAETKVTTKVNIPSVEELLNAGSHFGHQVRRWNPKMSPFIYKVQQGVHIVDLFKTESALKAAAEFLHGVATSGAQIIMVGTKGQAKEIIRAQATESGSMFVTERWLGGTLTNYKEVGKRLQFLKDYYTNTKSGALNKYTKKERLLMSREAEKLEKIIGGIINLSGLPGAVVVVDPHREKIVVRECLRMNVPIIAITDTNCDPTGINFVIPANDDAIKSIDLIVSALAGAIKKGYGSVRTEDTVETLHATSNANKLEHTPSVSDNKGDLSSLGLSNRSFNALTKAGIKTMAELKKANLDEIKGLGAKSLDEIKDVLKK